MSYDIQCFTYVDWACNNRNMGRLVVVRHVPHVAQTVSNGDETTGNGLGDLENLEIGLGAE